MSRPCRLILKSNERTATPAGAHNCSCAWIWGAPPLPAGVRRRPPTHDAAEDRRGAATDAATRLARSRFPCDPWTCARKDAEECRRSGKRRRGRPVSHSRPGELLRDGGQLKRIPWPAGGSPTWAQPRSGVNDRENQLRPSVGPCRTCRPPCLVLAVAEHVDRDLGQRDGAFATLASLDRLQVPAAVQTLQLSLDADLAALPGDLRPARAEQLGLAPARAEREHPEGAQVVPPAHMNEGWEVLGLDDHPPRDVVQRRRRRACFSVPPGPDHRSAS